MLVIIFAFIAANITNDHAITHLLNIKLKRFQTLTSSPALGGPVSWSSFPPAPRQLHPYVFSRIRGLMFCTLIYLVTFQNCFVVVSSSGSLFA